MFPVEHLADGLHHAFDPAVHGAVVPWTDLAVLAAWAGAGLASPCVSSFIHLDDAAAATMLALEHGQSGIYNVVDDEPAPLREWLPVLAGVLGARPPRGVPRWLARLVTGEAAVVMGTEARGASNAKAKRELGWTLRYPSWRQGFVAADAPTTAADARNER